MKSSKFLRAPSPSMAVALVALVVAMGGTGYAASQLPKNSVGAKQIKSGGVGTSEVADGSLLATDFAAGQLAAGPKGDRGSQGPQGEAGPSSVISAVKDGQVVAPGAAGSYVDVLTLSNVPAGDYLALALTNAVYGGTTFDAFRCRLLVNGTAVGQATGVTLKDDDYVGSIVRQEPLTLASTSTVKLNCGHDGTSNDPSPTAPRFERSRLSLIRTGANSVSVQ
jgi:hypothetical protein